MRIFDSIFLSHFFLLGFIVSLEIFTWVVRTVRRGLQQRRNRKLGLDEEPLLNANAGFRLGGDSRSAARRHFAREEEKLVTHLGWEQARPKKSPDG